MKSIVLYLFLLFGLYTVKSQDFKILKDTLTINIQGFPLHSLKYKNTYYCFFVNPQPDGDLSDETFYTFTPDGTITYTKNKSVLFGDSNKDLYAQDGHVMTQSYYIDKSAYYWNKDKHKWIETDTFDDVIFEDDDYYVTSVDFGEWGAATWFKDKKTGDEYQVPVRIPNVCKISNSYYLITQFTVVLIKDPRKLKKQKEEYYYSNIKEKGIPLFTANKNSHSFQGTEILYGQDYGADIQKPKLYIGKSFVYNNQLFHIVTDSNKTYIAKLNNKKFDRIKNLGDNFYIYKRDNFYRNNYLNETVIFAYNQESKPKFGFLEIKDNTVYLHYANQARHKPSKQVKAVLLKDKLFMNINWGLLLFYSVSLLAIVISISWYKKLQKREILHYTKTELNYHRFYKQASIVFICFGITCFLIAILASILN
jgi:hypothetical protein